MMDSDEEEETVDIAPSMEKYICFFPELSSTNSEHAKLQMEMNSFV